MTSSRRRWILTALALLLLLVLLWVLTAFQLDPAVAGPARISFSIRSGLSADYSAEGGPSLGSLSLSIISDVMQDLGMGPSQAEANSQQLQSSLLTPVPTATAVNYEGDPPPTLTPETGPTLAPTDAPSDTPEPTSSTSETPPPTATPSATDTPTATGTTGPKETPKPTNILDSRAPTEPEDTKRPSLSGGSLDVADGSTISCEQEVHITDLNVVDPEYSSGIDWVKLKYKIEGSSVGYVYSDPLSRYSGGWNADETAWNADYKGSIEIEFSDGYAYPAGRKALALVMLSSTATPTPDATSVTTSSSPTPSPSPTSPPPSATPTKTATAAPSSTPTQSPSSTPTVEPTPETYTVELWAIAKDNYSDTEHSGYIHLATYTMICP